MIGMYLDKGQAMSDWDNLALGTATESEALVRYAALDALVGYCVHRKVQHAKRTVLPDPPLATLTLKDEAEVHNSAGGVVAVAEIAAIDGDSKQVTFDMCSDNVLSPCTLVFPNQAEAKGGLYFTEGRVWEDLLKRTKKAEQFPSGGPVSLHDVFEVVALANKGKKSIRLSCDMARISRAIPGVVYQAFLLPIPARHVRVKLDLFHALQRLTQAADKDDPWFSFFVQLLKDAFTVVDEVELDKLMHTIAEREKKSLSDVDFELKYSHNWKKEKAKLPKYIPPPKELSEALDRVRMAARNIPGFLTEKLENVRKFDQYEMHEQTAIDRS